MSGELYAQRFLFGERVKCNDLAFVVTAISFRDGKFSYSGVSTGWYAEERLVLAPERPPYVPSERRVVGRDGESVASAALVNWVYRCETDDEMAARHAVEGAEYEQQDATNAVIYNASGQPIGITGRTGQPGPGAG